MKESTFSQEEKCLELAHTEMYLTATFDFYIKVLKFVIHTNPQI
jgi:hypothetical protein